MINWLQHGDANTKIFHTTTLKRRRNNYILSLRGQSENWISGEIPLEHILDHFSNIFINSSSSSSFTETLPIHHLCLNTSEGVSFFYQNHFHKLKLLIPLNHLNRLKPLDQIAFILFSIKNTFIISFHQLRISSMKSSLLVNSLLILTKP